MKKIGIDIGGTKLRIAIFDEEYNMIHRFKTENDPNLAVEENLAKLVNFINQYDYEFAVIGLGCPGPLNTRTGKILQTPNLPAWWNFPIVDYIETNTKIKTILENDANVAGLAEARLGAGKPYNSIYYITISTGIGGAYIQNKELVQGSNSAAGEIANLIINDESEARAGLSPGAINEICSGSALARKGKEIYGRDITSKEIFELLHNGCSKAKALCDTVVEGIATAINNITCIVDPDAIVLGGSIAIHNPDLVERITNRAKEHVWHPDYLKVLPARFEDDAGLYGAALLV